MDIYFSDDFIANQPDKVKEFIEISLRHYQPPTLFTAVCRLVKSMIRSIAFIK